MEDESVSYTLNIVPFKLFTQVTDGSQATSQSKTNTQTNNNDLLEKDDGTKNISIFFVY